MRRAVDQVTVMSAVGNRKQEVVGHRVVGAVALVLNLTRVDVGLCERTRHLAAGDQKSPVPRSLNYDESQVVRRRTYSTRAAVPHFGHIHEQKKCDGHII